MSDGGGEVSQFKVKLSIVRVRGGRGIGGVMRVAVAAIKNGPAAVT